ncbi:MAG: hypothetical protein NVSMB29_01590 [Candidatus Dormibacteria bacterium]
MTGPRFKNHTSVSAEEYDRTRRGHIEDRRLEVIEDSLARVGPADHVLEIGSGSGALLGRLASRHPELNCVGVELDAKLAAFAEERNRAARVRFIRGDITAVDAGQPFDLAYSVDVIHHMEDQRAAFSAIRRALRPGGIWLALEPNVFHPYVTLQQERMRRAGLGEDHFRPWRSLPLLEAAGLRPERRRYLLLFPAQFAPPPWLQGVERQAERLPILGGCVALTLRAV